jgi:hypothetical protein
MDDGTSGEGGFKMIYITGDLHGGVTAWHISSANFKPAKRGDICICCGDLGGVWYDDYHMNQKHRREEDYFLESQLRQRVTWLAVDGNHVLYFNPDASALAREILSEFDAASCDEPVLDGLKLLTI